MSVGPKVWDSKFLQDGHTGYNDPQIYGYDQPLRLQTVKRMLASLLPNGLRGLTALDVGCGTGDFVGLLLDLGCDEVMGVDISPLVAEATARRFSDQGRRVNIQRADISSGLPAMEPRDLITCITVLQHVISDSEAVEAACRLRSVLKPDGHLLVLEIAPSRPVVASDPNSVRERTVEQWSRIFAEAGFAHKGDPAVYSPLGFLLVQIVVPRFLRKILRSRVTSGRDCSAGKDKPVFSVRLYRLMRAVLLAFSYPFDYLLNFTPPSKIAYYRLFVLRPASGRARS